MKRAETLLEIRDVTAMAPLEGADLESFYVPVDKARNDYLPPSEVLYRSILEAQPPLRLLFASHPGAGKSTELNRLMVRAAEDFWFVRLDTRKVLDLASLTHIDLMIALTEVLYKEGRDARLIKNTRVIEPVRNWLQEVVLESRIGRQEDLNIEAGGGVDGVLKQIVGLFSTLRSAFSLSYESARVVRQVIQPRLAELRQHCNNVLTEIDTHLARKSPLRRLLVIVEDTDKIDVEQARELFVEHTGLLADLQTSIIYTVPIYLVHSPERNRLESYFQIRTLPMIKTYDQRGNLFEPGWAALRDVVSRRINTQALFEPDALELAIEKTGGVLRDLLRVIQTAGDVARYAGEPRISGMAMQYSLNELKSAYRNSVRGRADVTTEQLYEKMKAIAREPSGLTPVDDALQLLLYTQAVIEYNGKGWYGVHPLMLETLREMRYLDDLAARP